MKLANSSLTFTAPARRAFTLLEVVMVLIIMSITAAMAVPRYVGFMTKNRLEAAMNRVQADLEAAREKAKHTGLCQAVTFDTITHTYTIGEWKQLPTQTVNLAAEPYNARITKAVFNTDSTIVFDGFGEPDSTGSLTVQVGAYSQDLTIGLSLSRLIDLSPSIKVQ